MPPSRTFSLAAAAAHDGCQECRADNKSNDRDESIAGKLPGAPRVQREGIVGKKILDLVALP